MAKNSNFHFSQVPRADIPRSTFKRNHTYKTTLTTAGELYPFYLDEVVPGDTFNLNVNVFARMLTPIVPIMDNLYLDVFFFYTPMRLLWSNWQKFCGEQTNPGDSTSYTIPVITDDGGGFAQGSLYDYFGIPIDKTNLSISALPLRNYNLVWNSFFRDENLQNSRSVPLTDGPDAENLYSIQFRGKRHDYITSCLPWPQKGAGVTIPIGAIVGDGTTTPKFRGTPGASTGRALRFVATAVANWNPAAAITEDAYWDVPALKVNQAVGGTINDLRQAFQIQKLYERDARGGTRYTEILKAHYGVTAPDYRLQRPEYLGGVSLPVHVNPVAQTANTPVSGTPQGNLAAFAVGGGRCGFTKSFVEHGYVMGLVVVRADLSWQEGLDRMWSRRTRNEFYWPVFAHIGEQAVLAQEVQATSVLAENQAVFGYQERYGEYRWKNSVITGKFRSQASGTLDYWHLAEKFIGTPLLTGTFIQAMPPVARVVAVPSQPQFMFDSHFDLKCARPMPMYGVPGLVDHF